MLKNDDLRLGSLFYNENEIDKSKQIKVAFIGYAVDEGVRRNGGRTGARKGPEIVFDMLKKKGCIENEEYGVSLKNVHLKYWGTTLCDNETTPINLKQIHATHQQLVLSSLKAGYFPIIVGGGNDQSYPNYCALLDHLRSEKDASQTGVSVVNIDAHLDVRPLLPGDEPHSGSPFRQVLEDSKARKERVKLIEFAAQGSQCSSEHTKYVRDNGGSVVWLRDLSELGEPRSDIVIPALDKILNESEFSSCFMSLDIDSIRSSDCPGVSCPAVIGLSASQVLMLAMMAGKHKSVKMLDLSEFNPEIESYCTGVLVVNIIYYFLMGLVMRQ